MAGFHILCKRPGILLSFVMVTVKPFITMLSSWLSSLLACWYKVVVENLVVLLLMLLHLIQYTVLVIMMIITNTKTIKLIMYTLLPLLGKHSIVGSSWHWQVVVLIAWP